MICYFREDLNPFIKFEMEQQNRESVNFEEIVQRVVNAEAKVGLKSSIIVWDSDIYCPKGYRLSNSIVTKMQTQETTAKNSNPLEPKIKKANPILSRATKASEPSEQARKKKKKKRHPKRRDKKKQTPASTANATEV